jgi:hypothetical protein
MKTGKRNNGNRRILAPSPLHPRQIPYGPTWYRSRTTDVRSREYTNRPRSGMVDLYLLKGLTNGEASLRVFVA